MMEGLEELDVPRLSRQEGDYRDPNATLPLDRKQILPLTVNDFVSERTLILGQTGMGKGNAGALITEFLLEAGLPLTFIDLEGEGYSFKEICSSLLVVGRSVHADREYAPAQMGRLAELSVEQGFSVVLDLSGYADEEIFALVAPYLQSLWATCERLRTPYHLILDEAHELVPEEGTTPVKSLLRRIAKRGRKRGFGVVAMSQETASLDKKFIRQMAIRILLPVTYEADLKIYHTLIPGVPLDTLKNTMPAFPPGMGYVVFKHHPYLVHLLRRRTFDPSETPKLGNQQVAPILYTMDQQTLNRIDQALPSGQREVLEGLDRVTLIQLVRELRHHQNEEQDRPSRREDRSDEFSKLKKQLHDAESVIQEQIELLSRLSVQADGASMQETVQHRHTPAQVLPGTTLVVAQGDSQAGKNGRAEQIERRRSEELTLLLAEKEREIARLLSQLHTVGPSVDFPSTLAIGQVTVQHMHAPALTMSAVPVQPVVEIGAIERPIAFNGAKFASLAKRIQRLPELERSILRVLVEQQKGLTSKDIAAWLNVPESRIQNNPPTQLLQLGMIARARNTYREYVYSSKLMHYLRQEFPNADCQQLQGSLIYPGKRMIHAAPDTAN